MAILLPRMRDQNDKQSVKSVTTDTLFFATPSDFRAWLKANHEKVREQWVGFYRKASCRPSITWPQSVDEALCVGWIDGLRKSIDGESYRIRFTPRKPASTWSAVNTGRVRELSRQGRMLPAGLKAFERRTEARSGRYSYENRKAAVLSKAAEQQFRSHPEAWKFFQSQPEGYRKMATWWVISAKREATRQKRLEVLIADSEAGRRTGTVSPQATAGSGTKI
jgi:uncharacterized protein YdeI (YjbR/CyaY-like superfamily)